MKTKFLFKITLLFVMTVSAQTTPCGSVVDYDFDNLTALPAEWIEYNSTGRVSIDNSRLKLDFNADKPAVYHDFSPVTNSFSYAFDIESTRNYTTCYMNLTSSTGEYLASFTFGLLSNLSIQYASSISAGVPSGYTGSLITGNFTTNTTYSITANANFETQTIDIYNNGNLMAANVPFLESAVDVAKIDIQLNLMYSNEGRFFFDNISLISADANRLLLTTNVNAAQSLLDSSVAGDKYNQYPQSAMDDFQAAINNANLVLTDCNSDSNTIDNSLSSLQTDQDLFIAARVNDPVLKLYNVYNFSGEEHEVYCGYYNGGLNEYEDWAVSFTLEEGYMATFAQDINGLGFSKIYIAQDSALQINLPADLQRSISFIRVSPWYPVGKKGSLGDVKWTTPDNYNATWYYDWGLGPNDPTSNVEFVPMAWSAGANFTSLEKMEEIGQNMTFNHVLAFNEPDNSGQSNLTVAQALEAYPKLLASGLRIGAPGVENVQYSATNDSFNEDAWIKEFMDACVALGYRVDFIPAHDYVRRSKSTFIERFKGLHDRYNLPIWVTEYNYGNPNMGSAALTVEQGYTNIKGLTEVLEEADFVERYNWYYFFGATSGIGGISNGELNITGQFYRDFESPAPSYTQEVYEQGPQLSVDNNSILSQVLVYPTIITNGFFNLKYSNQITNNSLELNIYTTTGQLVKEASNLSSKIDVRTLSSGLYIVIISSNLGDFVQKIIIQ